MRSEQIDKQTVSETQCNEEQVLEALSLSLALLKTEAAVVKYDPEKMTRLSDWQELARINEQKSLTAREEEY